MCLSLSLSLCMYIFTKLSIYVWSVCPSVPHDSLATHSLTAALLFVRTRSCVYVSTCVDGLACVYLYAVLMLRLVRVVCV